MTTLTSSQPTAFETHHPRFVAERAAPLWLTERRAQGLAHFAELGLPTSRDEDWLYTDVRPLAREAFPPAPPPAHPPASLAAHRFALGLERGPRLVFLNGRYAPALSFVNDLPAGVTLTSFAALRASGSSMDWIEAALGRAADTSAHPFVALNQAYLDDAAIVHVKAGVTVHQPIQLLYLHAPTGARVAVHPRTLVVAEQGSAVTVVEHYGIDCIGALAGGTCLTNAVTEYIVGANASARAVRIQREGTRTYHVGFTGVLQARDSRFASTSISLGGAIDRNEMHVSVGAAGAECDLRGLYVIANEEHYDNHTVVTHPVPHGTSRQLFKGILGGKSRGSFTGRVVVAQHAQKTLAEQANHNLLLSDHAVAETRPQLEIYADDVKCAHGATIGRLDENALYYLRSRGIDRLKARNLLVHAFANEITESAGDPLLTAGLDALLAARLEREPRAEDAS
ncbi:MAG: Fe-S cluster assembly protein SufD [Planctomycetota bacterium]|nr:Fe-S cluster assembly protein SufD [Planctomycetota bacterium]